MIRLRTGLAAGGIMLLGAGSALAADLGGPRISMKDSEPAEHARPCSGERFSGFYAGGTVGITNLNSKWEETFADFNPDYQDSPLKTTRSGASGGLTLGYNRVRCNFLIGVESDFNFTHISGSNDHYPRQPGFAGPGFGRITDSMGNYATLRARMGFVADRTLFYATGGLAWAKLSHSLLDFGHFGQQPNPFEVNGWKAGWAIGGGFEHALTQAVSLKGEALYMDFGRRDYGFIDDPTLPVPDFYSFRTRQNAVTARIGINFKLGDFPPRGGCDDGRGRDCGAHPMK
jgi:outer membrane immunogenic protein